jgi:hypothetical protein
MSETETLAGTYLKLISKELGSYFHPKVKSVRTAEQTIGIISGLVKVWENESLKAYIQEAMKESFRDVKDYTKTLREDIELRRIGR